MISAPVPPVPPGGGPTPADPIQQLITTDTTFVLQLEFVHLLNVKILEFGAHP